MKTKDEVFEEKSNNQTEKSIKDVNQCKVTFSKSNQEMVSFKKDDSAIKLKYISSQGTDINPLINNDSKVAVYKNIEEGIDLKYELKGEQLKESFVINQKSDNYVFNFEANIGDLKPFFNEATKCLELKRNNIVVCKMLPPYMFDNKEQESNKCSYEIDSAENGILRIKLIADADWINSIERELPVIIDPTFEFETDTAMFHVSQSGDSVNVLSEQDEVFIGYKNQDDDFKFYSFQIDIDWSYLPSNIIASDKNFYFEMPVNYNIMDEDDEIIVFVNGNVTGIYKPSQLFNNNVLRLDVSESFKSGEHGTILLRIAADGLLARAGSEYYKSKTFKQGVYKASLQVRDSSGRETAKLIVEPKQESKQYIDYDIGVSGVTSINIQTGRYKHRINDLSISSGSLTLNIDHIFDSRNNSNGAYGQNWGLSICQHLTKEKLNNGSKVVSYTDEDGTNHIFIEKWFYKFGNTKVYVGIEDVTLSENNELVTRNGEPVEYEIINDEGYQYVSLGSVTNYDAKRKQYKYYINYNGFKKPVIEGQNNYLQFVYFNNGVVYYVDNANVEFKNRGFITKVGDEEKRVYLSSEKTTINFTTEKATIYYGANKQNSKQVTLQKVPVYENLDEGLYTSSELENLEYEANQAKYNLSEINRIILNEKSHELSLLQSMTNIDFNQEVTPDTSNEDKTTIENNNKLYSDFMQLENELISAYEQLANIERNEYFVTRNFNAKLKEQKESANDYIIDPDGNIILFDGYERMIGVMDNHENKIEIIYNKDSNVELIKSNEEQILFKYKNNKLEMMKKTNGDTVRFNYFYDNLIEITSNGRKTTLTYFNGLQVYSDINDEIIIDTQTTNTLKVKKYVEPGTINETKVFQPFVDRTLVQNDKYEYSNNFNTTIVTDRIINEITTIDFDFCGEIKKQEDEKYITYANYYKGKTISIVKAKKNPTIVFAKNDFIQEDYKYSLINNAKQSYPSKVDAYCLKVDLNDLPNSEEDLKTIILSISYLKNGETYNFKQSYINKDNEIIVLPFFLKGEVSNLTASVEVNVQSQTELNSYIGDISIITIEEGALYEYDSEDRLWKIKNNDGKITYLAFEDKLPINIEFKDWNGKVVTTDCAYNTEGKLISSIDSKGNVKNYLYQDNSKSIETKQYNLKDASLVRSSLKSYDENEKAYIEKGNIKNQNGEYPISKAIFYPGTSIIKTSIAQDGSKTTYNIHPLTKQVVGLIKENSGIKNSISYIYNHDFLTTVKDNETEINYTYDGRKRIKSVKIKGYSYNTISNIYSDNVTVTDKQNNSYPHGSIINTTYNGIYTITNKYTKDGNLISAIQGPTSNSYSSYFTYNDDELITSSETIKVGDNSYHETISYSYDDKNRISSMIKEIKENEVTVEKVEKTFQYNSNDALTNLDLLINNTLSQSIAYSYNNEDLLIRESINSAYQINYDYDALNRIIHQETTSNNNMTLCHNFSYLQQDDHTLDLIKEDIFKVVAPNGNVSSKNYKYSYDVSGKVNEIIVDDKKITYEYDAIGRLVLENNELLGVINKYSYDNLGSIVSKLTLNLSDKSLINHDKYVYSCDNKHLLVTVNDNKITYDAYGRIASYGDKDYIWDNNGTLKNISSNSHIISEYAYNDKGIRYKKILANGDNVRYVLDGNKILKEEHNTFSINYLYNINGLFGFICNNETYMYQKNIFGDIVRIFNSDAEIVGEYRYDAFGNVTIITDVNGIASLNPFRYRGYYFDNETELYYLNYRYYDPSIGRFISPDDISYINPNTINGLNLYAYCGNDPINYLDPTGHIIFSLSALIIGTLVGIAIGVGFSVVSQGMTNGWENINGWQVLLDGIIGGISGFIAASGIGALGAALISGGLGFFGSVGSDLIASNGNWKSVNWAKALIMGAVNFGIGFLAGAGSQNIKNVSSGLLKQFNVSETFNVLFKTGTKFAIKTIGKQGFNETIILCASRSAGAVSNALSSIIAKDTFKNLLFLIGITQFNMGLSQRLSE